MQAIILECSWSDTCGKGVAEAYRAESVCQFFPLLGVRACFVPFPFPPQSSVLLPRSALVSYLSLVMD